MGFEEAQTLAALSKIYLCNIPKMMRVEIANIESEKHK
jgi:hypothetical protein